MLASNVFTNLLCVPPLIFFFFFFFFFNDTATTEIYTLSLHDALPILLDDDANRAQVGLVAVEPLLDRVGARSEEHTSELQSRRDLVCRLLLEKKKKKTYNNKQGSITSTE